MCTPTSHHYSRELKGHKSNVSAPMEAVALEHADSPTASDESSWLRAGAREYSLRVFSIRQVLSQVKAHACRDKQRGAWRCINCTVFRKCKPISSIIIIFNFNRFNNRINMHSVTIGSQQVWLRSRACMLTATDNAEQRKCSAVNYSSSNQLAAVYSCNLIKFRADAVPELYCILYVLRPN